MPGMPGSRRPAPRAAWLCGALALAACSSEPATTTQDADPPGSSTAATSSSTTATGTDTALPSTSGGEAATGSTTAAACGSGSIDDCCCFEVSGAPEQPILGIACVAEDALCMAPQALCPDAQTQCEVADLMVSSPEGLECALEALASGKPGLVSWGISASDGIHGSAHNLFVQADRTAFVSTYAYDDVNYTYSAVERRALQPASFFMDCLGQADSERFACLEQATAGAATETCVDGFAGALGR